MFSKMTSFTESKKTIAKYFEELKIISEEIEYISGNEPEKYITLTNNFLEIFGKLSNIQQRIIDSKQELTQPEQDHWSKMRNPINDRMKELAYDLIKFLKSRKESIGYSDKIIENINKAEKLAVTAIDFIRVKSIKDELLALKYIQEIIKRPN